MPIRKDSRRAPLWVVVVLISALAAPFGVPREAIAGHGSWTMTTSMAECDPADAGCMGRTLHSATLLQNGKVLIAGGATGAVTSGEDAVTASAQLYDPGTGRWSATGSMNLARRSHSATLLDGTACRPEGDTPVPAFCGQVLVVGGYGPLAADGTTTQRSAELYDPLTGGWRMAPPPLAWSGSSHHAILLDGPVCRKGSPDCGKVLLVGGDTTQMELYDPAGGPDGSWSLGPAMKDIRRAGARFSANLLDGPACRTGSPPAYCGNVLVAGGNISPTSESPGTGLPSSASELYDPFSDDTDPSTAGGRWRPAPPMIRAREGNTGTLLDGPACRALPPAQSPTYCGKVLVVGGTGTPELYDPAGPGVEPSGSWAPAGPMNELSGRGRHTATRMEGPQCGDACDMVLVAGGFLTESGSAELYNPATNQFIVTDSMEVRAEGTKRRESHTATLLPNGKVMVAGGDEIERRAAHESAELYTAGDGSPPDFAAPPAIAVTDYSTKEGNAGTTGFEFKVALSHPPMSEVTVDYGTEDLSAVAPEDFTAKSGTLVFAPGRTVQTVTVEVSGDAVKEDAEIFRLNLSNPQGAFLAKSGGVGVVQNDDDVEPTSLLTIDDVAAAEGSNGGTTDFIFTVSLSTPRAEEVRVNYVVLDGTAGLGEDYQPSPTPQPLVYEPGQTQKQISVPVVADNEPERDEVFQVFLTGNTNSVVAKNQGLGVIRDDDGGNAPPALSISDVVWEEGSGGGVTNYSFKVSLTSPSGNQPVTVNYATANGTAEHEEGKQDYEPQTGFVQFGPTETEKTITVEVNADNVIENTEFFQVFLMDAQNAATIRSQAVGVIVQDDGDPIRPL